MAGIGLTVSPSASLVFDSHIKQNLLDYAATAMLFADSKVDPRLISCNR